MYLSCSSRFKRTAWRVRCLPRTITSAYPSKYTVLQRDEWKVHISQFLVRCAAILRGDMHRDPGHPLYNFIFKYYFSLNPRCFTHFSPGMNILLKDIAVGSSIPNLAFKSSMADPLQPIEGAYVLDPTRLDLTASKRKAMDRVLQLLKAIDSRPPNVQCYGLHEWAMLYARDTSEEAVGKASDKLSKFQSLPLRVTAAEIKQVLVPSDETGPLLRCTHYDAIRFFTQDAVEINRTKSPVPSRSTVMQLEQPGCIHVHMDLFKWAFKLYPLIPSELLLDTLEVALVARELDMRASPYDLFSYTPDPAYVSQSIQGTSIGDKYANYGFNPEPIRIETIEGKREYRQQQLSLYRRAAPARRRLIACYEQALGEEDRGRGCVNSE